MKQQHVSITIAARVGHSPIYPRIGQGLLGGTIVSVRQGDSEVAHSRLDELEHVFSTEFDRGELTVDNLRPVLWAAHWLKAVRPVAQRASELLTLAAERAFEPGSKAARDCDAVARVMAGVATTEPHCLTALEAARKIRVPADFYAADQAALSEDIATSALRVDGIRPAWDLSPEESQEISRRTRDAYVAALGLPKGMPASHPENCPDCDAIPTSPHGCGREGIHEAGQTYDDSPFRIYGFAHEMHELLQRINVAVGGLREIQSRNMTPTPIMLCECDQAIWDIWPLLARIQGLDASEIDTEGREARVSMINAADDYQAVLNCAAQQETLRQKIEQAMTCEILEADFSSSVITLQVRQRLEGIGVGLWKLVPYQRNSDGLAGAA